MATWHQSRNQTGLIALWAPDDTAWKCVTDKPGEFASAMLFRRKRDAERFARRTGAYLVAPRRYKPKA